MSIPFVDEEEDDSGEQPSDVHHNDWLMPDGGVLEPLAEYLFSEVEAVSQRPKKQRRDATQRRKDMVANIVANLALLSAYRPEGARLIISARAVKASRYERHAYPLKAFMGIISALEDLGFIERRKGSYRGLRTTIAPTDALRVHLPSEGTSPPLRLLPGRETIVLKAATGPRRPKVLVDYQDTPHTELMREQVASITSAINAATITLDGQRQPPVQLERQFQIGSPDAAREFCLHGRLYGGFWEYLPKARRPLLRIDGQQVAELDFSAMFVQLSYAEAGLPPPVGDPYSDIEGLGRDEAKDAVSALLCRDGPMKRLPKKLRPRLDRSWTAARLTAAVARRHPAISHLFGTGLGLRLMFTESRILIGTLLRLLGQDIVALPIHDSLLVQQPHEAACRAAMDEAAVEVVGRPLHVKSKINVS